MSLQCRCDICYESHRCIKCCCCLLYCCKYCINNDYMIRGFIGIWKISSWNCSQQCLLNSIIKTSCLYESTQLHVQNEIVNMNSVIKYVMGDIRQTKKYLMNYICKDVTNIIIEYSY